MEIRGYRNYMRVQGVCYISMDFGTGMLFLSRLKSYWKILKNILIKCKMKAKLLSIFLLCIISASYAQVKVEPTRETVAPSKPELKSLGKARLLSAICPGAGQFYVHNYWKGVIDFGIESILIGGTILSLNARANAREQSDEGATKEDWTILATLCGVSALGYYIFQIWRLNDDVVVYNYKKRFLESSSLRLNLTPYKYSVALAKAF